MGGEGSAVLGNGENEREKMKEKNRRVDQRELGEREKSGWVRVGGEEKEERREEK